MIANVGTSTRPSSFLTRAVEGSVFIGIWVALTTILRLSANSHLLLGVPLTLIFQLYVRGQPVKSLWVRAAPPSAYDAPTWAVALMLAVVPVQTFVAAAAARNVIVAGWGACAACGAGAAAYALRQFPRDKFIHLVGRGATALVAGIGILAAVRLSRGGIRVVEFAHSLQVLGKSLLGYFPACFLLEEVAFRGALDSHLHGPGDAYPLVSALLTSTLWGLWHLPLVPKGNLLVSAVGLTLLHCAIGVPLSLLWREHGNLAVPAFVHALIDAIRNSLLS